MRYILLLTVLLFMAACNGDEASQETDAVGQGPKPEPEESTVAVEYDLGTVNEQIAAAFNSDDIFFPDIEDFYVVLGLLTYETSEEEGDLSGFEAHYSPKFGELNEESQVRLNRNERRKILHGPYEGETPFQLTFSLVKEINVPHTMVEVDGDEVGYSVGSVTSGGEIVTVETYYLETEAGLYTIEIMLDPITEEQAKAFAGEFIRKITGGP